MTSYSQCPNKKCGHVFKSEEGFWWGLDWDKNPTVENMRCPKCSASTKPIDKRRKVYDFDDFVEVKVL